MTKKTRRVIFLFLLILFIIAAPLTVLYCLGWRFDWQTKKVIQPGIFYFKIWPKNAQVYLNDKLKKKTDFFFGSAVIENLLPREYNVKIKKDDFYTWEKTLEIKEREITEAKNIVLIPKKAKFKLEFNKIENFFFSPDAKKIILKEKNDKGWALKLFDLNKKVKTHLIEEKDISKKKADLIDLDFSFDSKKLLLKIGAKEKLSYYVLEIDKAPAVLIPLDFLEPTIESIYFSPKNSEKLLVLNEGKMREIDLLNKKLSLPLVKDIASLTFSGNDIYYLDNFGFLIKTSSSFDRKEKLNLIPFIPKKETEYKLEVFNSYVFIKENNVLYFLDENKNNFEKISDKVNDIRISPDKEKIVYFNGNEIWVFFLKEIYAQPYKKSGEKIFITRFSEKINQVFWYTNHYLIFNTGDKIKVAEIDDRDRINIVNLAEFKEPKLFWNQNNKKLYVLTGEDFFISETLAP